MKKTTAISALFAMAFMWVTCAKVSPTHRSLNGGSGNSVVDGNIAVERAVDGLSATLTFNTAYAASCKFAWYEDKTPDPDAATLSWTACTSPQPGRVFKETTTGLKPELLYAFAVKIWAQGATEDSGVIQRIHENAAPGDPNNRYTFRLDLPTKSAQIDGFTYSAGLDSVQKDFLAAFPCKVSDSGRSFPGTRLTSELPVKRVTSRGFYAGISIGSEDLSQGLLIPGAAIQTTSTEWVLNIQSKDTSGTVRLNNPGQLVTITATQDSTKSTTTSNTVIENTLDDIELAAFRMGQTSPLNIAWTTDHPVDNTTSLVVVTLTGPNKDVGITCGFDPKPGNAAIPPDVLAKFSSGRGFLTVRLENLQQPTKDRWFARVVDWRSIQVLLQ